MARCKSYSQVSVYESKNFRICENITTEHTPNGLKTTTSYDLRYMTTLNPRICEVTEEELEELRDFITDLLNGDVF